jgi:hypothetical protein
MYLSGIQRIQKEWIPISMGMTEKGVGMTEKGVGMTEKGVGMTKEDVIPECIIFVIPECIYRESREFSFKNAL